VVAIERREMHDSQDLSDPAVFGAFYDQALPVVYGYFLRRTGGLPALAEDLTQETFLAAVKQIRKGTRVGAPMPWIVGIARHRLVDHYRATAGPANRVVALGDWIDEQPDERDDFGPILDRDLAIAVLDALPASQRMAIALRYLDGMSVPDIAGQSGKSVHAVESLLARGRATFKRHYREHGHE
jgi:RNA polymerase sigma-70 factor, ECF subfamily